MIRADGEVPGQFEVIAVVPTVLVVAFFQRYIVSGLTAGALKGR